jgi:uncharacterized SAM-binding protein YcdF (DUF218 family)
MMRRFVFYSFRIFVIGVMGGSFWLIGLILFTRMIPSLPQDDTMRPTDGIVVFTGGKTRLKVALNLFHQKKGHSLLISGVNPDSTFSEMIKQMPFRSRVTLGYDALNTEGNAEETALWVQAHNIKTLRLITSNYHMPRSLFELRHLLPTVDIIPYPVVEKSFLKPKWWLESHALRLVVQEYNKFLFSLIHRSLENLQNIFNIKENT